MNRLALLLILFALGCASQPRTETTPMENTAATADTLLVFERTPCYGYCPAYRVTLTTDGALVYEGLSHVATEGFVREQLSPETVDAIRAAVTDARFFEFPAELKCRSQVTDNPAVYVTVQMAGQRKRIDHDRGCTGFPGEDRLLALEDRLDALLGTARWVGKVGP